MTSTFWDGAPARLSPTRMELLHLDPDLGSDLDSARGQAAARHLTVPIQGLDEGDWAPPLSSPPAGSLGLLVIDGVLMRTHSIGKVISAELLGSGDVISPSVTGHEFSLVEAGSRWEVVSQARVAVLDPTFVRAALNWPEVVAALFERTVYRARFIAFQMAISHVRRIDGRLLLLFWRLADRWGRVTPEGVVVPLRLKHAVLGMLVGARRPSVTTALKQLSEAGTLDRRPDGSWLLRGDPPDSADPALEPLTLRPPAE
jgi:hypothetical protein